MCFKIITFVSFAAQIAKQLWIKLEEQKSGKFWLREKPERTYV